MRRFQLISITAFILLTGCQQIAIWSTPGPKAKFSHTALANKAENAFWNVLHKGHYNEIENVDYLLTAAFLENPHDPKLAAHIAFLHLWKIAERQRQPIQDPRITNEVYLAHSYFTSALKLDPYNPIYHGFFGDTQLIRAQILKDKREEVRGYFQLKKAITLWPEFNYFTAGYPMSSLPADSKHFKEGLNWQWATLDACAGKHINRKNPNYRDIMPQETQKGRKRACWNSWIAPYNFEGFFMNMGDMLIKSGDVATGILIYENAKLAKNYYSWPYKAILEEKIKHAHANVKHFQKPSTTPDRSIMFNSSYACMACHQR